MRMFVKLRWTRFQVIVCSWFWFSWAKILEKFRSIILYKLIIKWRSLKVNRLYFLDIFPLLKKWFHNFLNTLLGYTTGLEKREMSKKSYTSIGHLWSTFGFHQSPTSILSTNCWLFNCIHRMNPSNHSCMNLDFMFFGYWHNHSKWVYNIRNA